MAHTPVTLEISAAQAAALYKAITSYLDGQTFATIDIAVWDRLDEILAKISP